MSTKIKPTLESGEVMRGGRPESGNIGLGFWLSEDVVCPSDDIIFLKGPRIARYISEDYDTFNPRYDSENLTYGVSAVYNRTSETYSWITQHIDDVDANGKKITFSNAASYVSKGDTIRVYYYAKPSYYGGNNPCFLDGSPLAPEHIDSLVRSWNDSVPMTFGKWGRDMVTEKEWRWRPDMITANFQSGNISLSSWEKMIDFSKKSDSAEGEWSAVDADNTDDYCEFPIYANEISFYFRVTQALSEYPPKTLAVKVKIDGTYITKGHGDSRVNYCRMRSISDSGVGDAATDLENTYPGAYNELDVTGKPHTCLSFFKMASDADGFKYAMAKLDLGEFCIRDSIEVEVYLDPVLSSDPPDSFYVDVRGWAVLK